MTPIHLISYGDSKYQSAKETLYQEALTTGWFSSITMYSPEDLDDNFKQKFKNILDLKRGGGYWIWKCHIILKKFDEINDGDILIYVDAGCSINPRGKKRLDEYVDMLNKSDDNIISFKMNQHLEKKWTTKEIFRYFKVPITRRIANSGQLVGGIRIMKKNKKNIKIIQLENKTLENNPLLFTDFYSTKNQLSIFKENRHDQSVFSIIRKLNNTIVLPDETDVKKAGHDNFPFWASRRRNFKRENTTQLDNQKIRIFTRKSKNNPKIT